VGTLSDSFKPGYVPEGLSGFLERVASLIKEHENLAYYLYECRLSQLNENDFLPKIKDFTLKIVTTENELDQLTAEGYDLSLDSPWTRKGIQKGAVAFFIFVGNELASREIVATNAEAKLAIDDYPYKVDFANREACASGVWTNPKFRKMGLHTYVFFRAYDYLWKQGIRTVRSIVAADNIAAQKAHARFRGMKKYARGRYFKILGFTICKQTGLK
jgi:RimJ/RimL family protein N-acetyltransferase